MDKLALTLPGFSNEQFTGPESLREPFQAGNFTLGGVLSEILPLIFYVAVLLCFAMLLISGLRWLFSGGNKEVIAKSRARITYAFIGLAITLIAMFISNFVRDVINPANVGITPLNKKTFNIQLIQTVYAKPTSLKDEYSLGFYNNIGEIANRVIPVIFYVAGLGILIYIIWTGFKYLVSGGNKEEVAKARAMIQNALIGFLILMLSFFVIQFFLSTVFKTSLLRILGL